MSTEYSWIAYTTLGCNRSDAPAETEKGNQGMTVVVVPSLGHVAQYLLSSIPTEVVSTTPMRVLPTITESTR